jgi:hypothetical protein
MNRDQHPTAAGIALRLSILRREAMSIRLCRSISPQERAIAARENEIAQRATLAALRAEMAKLEIEPGSLLTPSAAKGRYAAW